MDEGRGGGGREEEGGVLTLGVSAKIGYAFGLYTGPGGSEDNALATAAAELYHRTNIPPTVAY